MAGAKVLWFDHSLLSSTLWLAGTPIPSVETGSKQFGISDWFLPSDAQPPARSWRRSTNPGCRSRAPQRRVRASISSTASNEDDLVDAVFTVDRDYRFGSPL